MNKVIKGLEQFIADFKPFCGNHEDWKKVYAALDTLKEQETVVRCKDCIYADDFDCPAPLPTGYLCRKGHGSHLDHWFCADGKRR